VQTSTNLYRLNSISERSRRPTDDEADDHGDHRLQNVQLRARQLGASSSAAHSSRLLQLNLAGVSITWRGRHGDVLIAGDGLSLASDDAKDAAVTVHEDRDRQSVVEQKVERRERLSFKRYSNRILICFCFLHHHWPMIAENAHYYLFRHSCRPAHRLNHLHTVKPRPPGAMQLRTGGHQFELSAVKYEFNKRNFIVRSLFNYV